jgi:CheY-like chemotaxis protein
VPEVDGITATRQILTFCRENKVPPPIIVGITADISEAIKIRCVSAGMMSAITKPIRVHALQSALLDVANSIELRNEEKGL